MNLTRRSFIQALTAAFAGVKVGWSTLPEKKTISTTEAPVDVIYPLDPPVSADVDGWYCILNGTKYRMLRGTIGIEADDMTRLPDGTMEMLKSYYVEVSILSQHPIKLHWYTPSALELVTPSREHYILHEAHIEKILPKRVDPNTFETYMRFWLSEQGVYSQL